MREDLAGLDPLEVLTAEFEAVGWLPDHAVDPVEDRIRRPVRRVGPSPAVRPADLDRDAVQLADQAAVDEPDLDQPTGAGTPRGLEDPLVPGVDEGERRRPRHRRVDVEHDLAGERLE